MPGRLWKFSKAWTAGCQCGMKATSSLPRRRRLARYSFETATSGQHLFLSLLPAPTVWANAGPRLSNPWTHGQRTRGIKGTTLTAQPRPASPKAPPRASQHSSRGRGGRRFRKPGARACRLEQSSGTGDPQRAIDGTGDPQRHRKEIPGL